MTSILYLATSYYHDDPKVREERYHIACKLVAALFKEKIYVYSPIVHNVVPAQIGKIPSGYDIWQEFDEEMCRKLDGLIVAKIDGWQESKGVQAEINLCKQLHKIIQYLEMSKVEQMICGIK